jgi:hypothetical protein
VSGHRHPPCARAHGLTRRQTLGAAAALAPTLMLPRRALAAPKGALTLLHTNDTHSRMEPFSSGKHKGGGRPAGDPHQTDPGRGAHARGRRG